MTTIDERVKGFVEQWRLTHCAVCHALLEDGNFIVLDGKFFCLKCHDRKTNDTETRSIGDAEIEKSV